MSIFKQSQSTNFSIVLPSQRWEWIRMVLNSIYDLATYPNMIDTHIAINTGDMRMKAILDKYREKNSQVYYYEINPKEMTYGGQVYPGIVKYVNWLTIDYSKGQYIMPMNDDAIFAYKDWDSKALSKLPDDIVLGITKDNIGARGFGDTNTPTASFPIISRKGIEHFGWLFSTDFYHNTADTHICYTYYQMKKTVDLTDCVFIKHRTEELTENISTDYLDEVEKCGGLNE
jgi:hypothetical protein